MAKYEDISVKFQGKRKKIKARKLSHFGMARGLCFRSKSFSDALLFNFNRKIGYSIHSLFVYFDFVAVWLDDKNTVQEVMIVTPGKISVKPRKLFYRLIEIPMNKSNRKLIEFFVGKRKI